MRPQLKYWRDLSKQQKATIKAEHNIKTVTFEFICEIYLKKVSFI